MEIGERDLGLTGTGDNSRTSVAPGNLDKPPAYNHSNYWSQLSHPVNKLTCSTQTKLQQQ
jgi:hypothetical protein